LAGRHHAVGIIGTTTALARNVTADPLDVIAHDLRLGLRQRKAGYGEQEKTTFPPSHVSS
jgi:hypothetical protein